MRQNERQQGKPREQGSLEDAAFQRRMLIEAEEAQYLSRLADEDQQAQPDRNAFDQKAMRVIFSGMFLGTVLAACYTATQVVFDHQPGRDLWEMAGTAAIVFGPVCWLRPRKREVRIAILLVMVVGAIGLLSA